MKAEGGNGTLENRRKERMKAILFVLVIGLLLALAGSVGMGLAQGQEPPQGEVQPQGDLSIDAEVSSKFSYQGVLKESGSPVTGSREMIFRLYSDSACTGQVGSDIVKNDVPVANGLFSVELAVLQSSFNGQGVWLEVEVGGTAIGCQEILAVPYALSLNPGAIISDTRSYVRFNYHLATIPPNPTDWEYGVYAKAQGSDANYGVYGSGSTAAFYGNGDVRQTLSTNGTVKAGVLVNCNNDLILGSVREFNNVTGDLFLYSAGSENGECTVDFGFDINDRYWLATAVGDQPCFVTCSLGAANDQLACKRWNVAAEGQDGNIMILVY